MKKKSSKIVAGGIMIAAASAAMGYAKRHPETIKPAVKQMKKLGYRANTKIMEQALNIMPETKPEVEIGIGSAKKIPEILKKAGITRAMIVTDPNVGKLIVPPIYDQVLAAGISCVIYDQVEENPSVATVEAIRDSYIENNCDGFLAIGGGSPMDAAKAAGARIARPKTPIDRMSGLLRVLVKIPPVVAVPTTSGTGSEVTMGAVISNHEERHKYAIMDPVITPKYAVIDPALTVTMPPFITATTGIDTLTHAVESYLTWAYNTNQSNRYAEEAVIKVFTYLEMAYADGEDMEARQQMLVASYKAGLAFNRTGVGYVHAIAHAMGGIYNTAHGLANSVILPIVLEDYGSVVHPQLAHLAEITGIKTSGTDAEKANAFIRAIRSMNERMGLPTGFDFIQLEDFDQIISWALAEANHTYPVPVIYDEERCRHVLNRILLEA